MASTDSIASWHPAFRANSEIVAGSSSSAFDNKPAEPPISESSFDIVHQDEPSEQHVDAWFSEDAKSDANWLAEATPVTSDDAVATQPAEAPVEVAPLSTAETASDHPAHEPVESETHASNKATSPEGLDWAADVETEQGGEWFGDSKDAADPFQFMPPSERTNSFPSVPPLEPTTSSHTRSLSRSQAQDLMAEFEAGEDGAFATREAGPEDDIPSARFEEGMPLLAQQEQQPTDALKEASTTRIGDAFADEEDDFFSHIRDGNGPETASASASPWALERKSTTQAMGLDYMMSSAQAPDLGDTREDDEEAGDADFVPTQEKVHQGDTDVAAGAAPGLADAMAEEPKVDEDTLAAKWSEAFADDDLEEELLLDDDVPEVKEMDPAAFFGSDDEGFLEDLDEQPPAAAEPACSPATGPAATDSPTSAHGRYAPQAQSSAHHPQSAAATLPYGAAPAPVAAYQPASATQPPVATPFGTAPYGAPPPQRPALPKAQSFADKAKGGYTSPYDLPMEVVKPRKRASMQQLPRSSAVSGQPLAGQPPPRSASMYQQGPASPADAGGHVVPEGQKMQQPPKPKESFFEDLPMTARPRPSPRPSRTSSPALGLSQSAPPGGPPSLHHPSMQGSSVAPPPTAAYQPAPAHTPAMGHGPGLAPSPDMVRSTSGSVHALVQPEKAHPYAPAPAAQMQPVLPASAPVNAYVPSLSPHAYPNGNAPPASSRYSPAPTAPKQSSSNYAPMPSSAPLPPILPHQPRTSSPLAHFETTAHRSSSQPIAANGESHLDRRTSLPHELRFNRVPSLPPTREVDEEHEQVPPQSSHSAGSPQSYAAGSRYSPAPPLGHSRTPPPLAYAPGQATLSPPKRSPPKRSPQGPLPYQPDAPNGPGFAPPPRSYSQSPGSMQRSANGQYAPTTEPIRRPSSVHTPTAASFSQAPAAAYMPSHRARAPSLTLNLIPPTDGRENDPLQRWKGAPLVCWGLGGTILTSFPKNVPRYGVHQTAPMIVRTPGEIKVDLVKDLVPLEDRLAKFPGPLKGKSKKKETVAWLSAGIESLTNGVLDPTYAQAPSLDDKRAAERILLWKILRIFIENDGVLEGSAAVQKAVRDVLVPGLDEQSQETIASLDVGSVTGSLHSQSTAAMRADAVDPAGIELIRKCLMVGDREKAVWAAVDKRLWGHAMLIANSVSPDLYKQVAQEFVRKEVNYPGYSNESVAALYKVLSGSHEDCVDELVPVHARAGLQLMSTTAATGAPSKDALDGLNNWRETLCLILSNRSLDDTRALIALGELLSSYGRAEAAHLCFIFARQISVFGGQDDPRSHFVLIGADHKRQGDQLYKDTEALLLSEVYEYGMCLAGAANATAPHLAAYKLQLASTLAEYGQQSKALEYCAVIDNAVHAQTKRSPYFSPALEHAVHELIGRLKQAPKEESSSWIPKPSMNKVSDSMWSTFNKFVSGDDNDKPDGLTNGENGAESGPFARVAGGTPNISRSPSAADLNVYGASNVGYLGQSATGVSAPMYSAAPAQPTSVSASRYAPTPQHAVAPANPYEAVSSPYTPRSSGELGRNSNPYDTSRPSTGYQQQYNPAPSSQATFQPTPPGAAAVHGVAPESSHPAQAQAPSYQPQVPATPTGSGYTPLSAQNSPYAPKSSDQSPASAGIPGDSHSPGYQAPSYGFEPPSMTPAPEEPPAVEDSAGQQDTSSGGYEPPSYQSYGYEPPSYEPDADPPAEDGDGPSKPKKSFMDDDEDDVPAMNSRQKTKAEKDRENEEMIRRVAEQEAKQAAEKGGKKGWGFGSWFGGSKKETLEPANKPVKANLGEQSSFVYDPDLKRWINKKGGAETTEAKSASAPPPRGPPRSTTSTPPPPMSTPPQGIGRASAPPPGPPQAGSAPPTPLLPPGVSPAMARSVSNQSMGPPSGPPSRPTTSMSNASSIDDLLSAAGPRKPGQKKARKTARYVDVMAK